MSAKVIKLAAYRERKDEPEPSAPRTPGPVSRAELAGVDAFNAEPGRIAQRFRKARAEAGVTQAQLAAWAELPVGRIRQIERGGLARPLEAKRIGVALDCCAEWLIFGTGMKRPVCEARS